MFSMLHAILRHFRRYVTLRLLMITPLISRFVTRAPHVDYRH